MSESQILKTDFKRSGIHLNGDTDRRKNQNMKAIMTERDFQN